MAIQNYTYITFAQDVIAMIDNLKGTELLPQNWEAVQNKAQALLTTQSNKAEYNATHPKKSTAKGASEATKAKASAISTVLSLVPKTTAEINEALGTDYTALQVANAVKYIDGVRSTKVIREVVNAKGLKAQKEYTAYTMEA